MSSRQSIIREIHGQNDSEIEDGPGIEREVRGKDEKCKTSNYPVEGEQISVHTKMPTTGL